MPSASEGTPSQRTSFVYVRPPRMKCVCASFSPGMTMCRPASITRVFAPLYFSSSPGLPTARIFSPLIAIASAFGCLVSRVAMRPLTIRTSAVSPGAKVEHPASAALPIKKSRRETIPHLLVLGLELDAGSLRLHEDQRGEVLLGHALPDHLLQQVAGKRGG